MKLSEYRNLLDDAEADWLDRLERHAEDTGTPLETVLAEALIDRHRDALREASELEQATANMTATIKRLTSR